MKTNLKVFAHFGRLPVWINDNFNAMLGVKARPLLRKLFIAISAVCRVRVQSNRLFALSRIVSRLSFLRRTMGLKGTCLYLKAVVTCLQQALGGMKIPDSALVSKVRISRNNAGIPKIIPASLRREIRMDNFGTIKLLLSILNVYRAIDFPGTPKLQTITAPFSGDPEALHVLFVFVKPFAKAISGKLLDGLDFVKGTGKLFLILKAAPGMLKHTLFGVANYSSHPHNVLRSLQSLHSSELWKPFKYLVEALDHKPIAKLVEIAERTGLLLPFNGALGKLHAKEEAAGKVRIFAMVDVWTQWILFPIHRYFFTILKRVDEDGTFAQTRPLEKSKDWEGFWCFDLSAATDRLPLSIQVMLMSEFFNVALAEAWADLLVNRSYGFYQMGYEKWHGFYKYAVGQPMGAYSSWALLAITHHFMVQVSAWRSGVCPVGVWFTDYAVLGDDLVIGNHDVAMEYLKLCKELGVEINLSKSIISPKGLCLEFAKRTYYKGVDVSPVPIKEMAAAQGTLPAMVEFAIKYSLTLPHLLKSFAFGWRNVAETLKPLYKLPSQVRSLVLAMSLPKSPEEMFSFFNIGKPKMTRLVKDLVQIGIDFKLTTILDSVPRFAKAVKEAEDFIAAKPDHLKAICESWVPAISEYIVPGSADSPFETEVNTWISTSYFKEDFHVGLLEFFEVLYTHLYGPASAAYLDTVQDVLFNVEGMAGKHRSNSMLVLPSFHTVDDESYGNLPTMVSYGWFHRYWDYLHTLEEFKMASPNFLTWARPEGLDGLSTDHNFVVPSHLRFYRLWAKILQGVIPAAGYGLKIPRPPLGIVPSEAAPQ